MEFSRELLQQKEEILASLEMRFKSIDAVAEANTRKVIDAMRRVRVSDVHFNTSSGYAYDDVGRTKLEELYRETFRSESALVRTHFVSGTHALATVLFGILRPGDRVVSLTGTPYDTMQTVLGYARESNGSLKEFGICYDELALLEDGSVDMDGIERVLETGAKMVMIQRSRGYSKRPSLSVTRIGAICEKVHAICPDCICFVDNCYGEFVEEREPIEVGADIAAGSLIKNPGGGLAPTGGYIVGREDLVELASYRLTSPGMGAELGASLSNNRYLFQGLFMAPHVVAQALKGAVFAAALFSRMGYPTFPKPEEERYDIIQAIELGTAERLAAFCRGVQYYSPVDSFVTPEPWDMPGYSDQVIMAAGTFVQGASIEFSADGPMRAPYNVYLQGGLIFEQVLFGILGAAAEIEQLK